MYVGQPNKPMCTKMKSYQLPVFIVSASLYESGNDLWRRRV